MIITIRLFLLLSLIFVESSGYVESSDFVESSGFVESSLSTKWNDLSRRMIISLLFEFCW